MTDHTDHFSRSNVEIYAVNYFTRLLVTEANVFKGHFPFIGAKKYRLFRLLNVRNRVENFKNPFSCG